MSLLGVGGGMAGLHPPYACWEDRGTIGVDREAPREFRAQGPGFQTRINAVLRVYWEAKRDRVV